MASSTAKAHLPAAANTQHPPAPSSQLAEDDSRKKNTDCVYFLASPLTCKKGSECDYRHSEYARVNPRDCWYWLNGTCLNPKCSFRHPPLDTPVVTPADSSAAPTMAGYPSSTAPQVSSAPQVAPKSTAPCIFFQNGYCMKGDRCPFFHMQMSSTYRAPEFPAANKSEPSRFNTPSGGLKNCSQIKVAPQGNVSKPIEAVSSQPKASVFALKVVPRDGAFAAKSGVLPHHSVSVEDNKHNDTAYRSVSNGSTRNKPSFASLASPRDDQRESSPGFDFDVLVHDEGGEADYYGNDDQFPGIQGHEGRDVNGRPDRYQSLDDPLVFHDRHGYEKYNPQQERRARDTSDRQITEGSHYDRRGDETRTSDLRSRLSKQRRTNGLSSVVNTDKHGEEHRHRSSRRDSRHSPPRGSSSISSRLQGRIKLPGQASSAINPPSIRSERDYDRGRNYPRLSPNRPQLQPHRGRLQDRLKTKIQDDIGRDAIVSRRDVLDYNSPNFVAPKSLAELKKGKQVNKIEEFNPLGKRKALESSRRGEDVLSFEPPKPLSEILKRKRKAEDNNDVQTEASSEEENKPSSQAVENKASSEAHNLELDNKTNPAETEISQANNVSEGEEEGLITEGVEGEGVEEEYYEEEGEGVYEEEEQDGGEGYTLEEGENGELEEEYMDEDEDDSFAKKIGVMFS